jgi:hypothetical protein
MDAKDEAAEASPPLMDGDISKAARYTLLSMDQHRSVGQLALRYHHVGNASTPHIAYATGTKCVYGPRFAQMDRFSQTFVVFHEVMHNVLAHLQQAAILYKREGSRFNGIAFNIACDAIINYVAETLPDVDKMGTGIRYGVRKCAEFGIVNWFDLQSEIETLATERNLPVDPLFNRTPNELSCVDIYYALMKFARQLADDQNLSGASQSEQGPKKFGSVDDVMNHLGEVLDAHDDLSQAVEKEAEKTEGDLLDHISRQENILRQAQAGAKPGDAILRAHRPDGMTKTPWHKAMRRMASSALLHKPSVDHRRPSRRVISQVALALNPSTPDANRPKNIIFEPRNVQRIPAKRCVTVIDTSGSMYADKQLLRDCIREIGSICKRVNSSQTIIFADAAVCDIVDVEDSTNRIAELQPKGGGGTDFRPAIELAQRLQPDLIVYITDLAGTFPDRKPKAPIIWAYPPMFEKTSTPFGQRLPLHP